MIFQAETKAMADEQAEAIKRECEDRFHNAAVLLTKDEETLLSFCDFPASYWPMIRSTDVIESAFAKVRLRQRVPRDAGTRSRGLVMAHQLLVREQKI